MKIPSSYIEGYNKARLYDQALADDYIGHVSIGDPELDPIMQELSAELPPGDLHRFIGAGIEENDEALRRAPRALRDFFDNLQEPPWLDYQRFRPGIRAFHANVDLMLTAFVTGVLVEGFSTLIAKSFNITGRVANSSRRLQQNNRHMMEIFFPAGLQRSSEGWKLSMRIRFVHARIRGLLAKSDEWEHETWGMPLSAAHLGFAISVFSKRLLEYSAMLGARFSKEEKDSVLAIWRYSGHVMGIPDTILYSNAEDAEKTYKISYLCEPPPDADSVAVANLLIQSIPKVANLQDPEEQEKLVSLAYRLARLLRTNQMVRLDNFTRLLQISVFDEDGLSYKLPDHVHTLKSKPW